jgi:hypothetical protein
LGFPTGWSFTTHKESSGGVTHAPVALFLALLPGKSGRLLRGEFSHAHPLLYYCFALLYLFYLHRFISKTQKN